MSETLGFIKDRAVKTISAAKELAATWTWEEKSPAQMQAELWAITGNTNMGPPQIGQEEIASAAKRAQDGAAGLWDAQLAELHRRTVQALGMLRNRVREDAAALAVLKGLSASSNSRKETLAEALALESAWHKLAPMWNPTTINTFPAFSALRKQCAEELQQAYSDAHTDWRTAVTKLNALADALEQSDEAWYADATRVFAVGTPEGDMIRSTVPTTYHPPTPAAAPPPVVTAAPTPTT